MDNKHIKAVQPADLEAALAGVQAAAEHIAPYRLPLSPKERQELPKMGEITGVFVGKVAEFSAAEPIAPPPYFDKAAFEVDYADATNLVRLRNAAQALTQSINDIMLVAGSEAYQGALQYYNGARLAANSGVPGAKLVYEELKKRFPHSKRRADATEATA